MYVVGAAAHLCPADAQTHSTTIMLMCFRRPEPGQSALVPQADEIEAAAWMPLEEYAALPFIQGRPLLLRTLECCLA